MHPVLAAVAVAAALVAPPASDPAAVRIEGFYPVLLETMKQAKTLDFEGRQAKLRPAVEQLFAFATMAQFAAGPQWTSMSTPDRRSIVQAMSRYTVRSYAHDFASYSGEQLRVDPEVKTHGVDKLVKTTITSKTAAPDTVIYRMRESGGAWKVIDVYYNSVSQVTVQRSAFAATLASGGASALVRELDSKTLALN